MSKSEMEREGGCEKSLLDMSGMDFKKEFEELEKDPEFYHELARLEYVEMKYRAEQAEVDLAKCRAFIKHLEEECNCTDDYSDAIYEWKKAKAKGADDE